MHTSVITIFVVVLYIVEIKTYEFVNSNNDRDDSIGPSKLIYSNPIESSGNMNYHSETLNDIKEQKQNKGNVITTEGFQISGRVNDKKDIDSEIIEDNQSKKIYDAKLPEGNRRLFKEDNVYSLENRIYGGEHVETAEVNEDVPIGPGFISNMGSIASNGFLNNKLSSYPLMNDHEYLHSNNQGQKKIQSQFYYKNTNEQAPQRVYRDTTNWNQNNNAYVYQPDTDNNDGMMMVWSNDYHLKNVEPLSKGEKQIITGEILPMGLSSNAYRYEPEDGDNNHNNDNANIQDDGLQDFGSPKNNDRKRRSGKQMLGSNQNPSHHIYIDTLTLQPNSNVYTHKPILIDVVRHQFNIIRGTLNIPRKIYTIVPTLNYGPTFQWFPY